MASLTEAARTVRLLTPMFVETAAVPPPSRAAAVTSASSGIAAATGAAEPIDRFA